MKIYKTSKKKRAANAKWSHSPKGIDWTQKYRRNALNLEINREHLRMMRLAFPEQQRVRARTWWRLNPKKIRTYRQNYRREHALVILAGNRRWRQANPEKVRAGQRTWRQANPEKVRGYGEKHRRANLAKFSAKEARRRARKRHALVPGPQWEIAAIYKRRDALIAQGIDVEVDHIYPMGFGWHEPANLQILSASENSQKCCHFDFKPVRIFK